MLSWAEEEKKSFMISGPGLTLDVVSIEILFYVYIDVKWTEQLSHVAKQ